MHVLRIAAIGPLKYSGPVRAQTYTLGLQADRRRGGRDGMALKSTIFKADLQIADMDRNFYGDHSLTIARHPSETDERMMVRLLAFALHANDALVFADSIGNDDEP